MLNSPPKKIYEQIFLHDSGGKTNYNYKLRGTAECAKRKSVIMKYT